MPLEPWQWALFILAALCTGLAKAGLSGVSLISVFVIAELFGAKSSIGVVLPMLIAADLMVFPAYRKYASWKLSLIHI